MHSPDLEVAYCSGGVCDKGALQKHWEAHGMYEISRCLPKCGAKCVKNTQYKQDNIMSCENKIKGDAIQSPSTASQWYSQAGCGSYSGTIPLAPCKWKDFKCCNAGS